MKIIIANIDRTAEFGPALKSGADNLAGDPVHAGVLGQQHALSLRDAKSEPEFLDRWTELVRRKSHVDVAKFDVPRKPGTAGAVIQSVRIFLWKLLRYQHDRIVSRQNFVNSQLAATLEFQRDEIRRLRERVDKLDRNADGAK